MTEFVSVGGEHYTERFNKTGYLLAFIFKKSNQERAFPARVLCPDEHPDFVASTQFGTAGVIPATSGGGGGTGGLTFVEPTLSNNQHQLDPQEEDKVLHWFVGLSPAPLRLFCQYPLTQFRDALPAVGGVDITTDEGLPGYVSPYLNPSIRSENWGFNKVRPAYNLYNPTQYSQTCKVKFYCELLEVEWLKEMSPAVKEEMCRFGRKVKVGGIIPVNAPDWMSGFNGFSLKEVGMNG